MQDGLKQIMILTLKSSFLYNLQMIKLLITIIIFFFSNTIAFASIAYMEDVVAKTLYLEAGDQSTLGKEAVAAVIWNRANGKKENFVQVCLAKKQFSCWNRKKPHHVKIKDNLSYRICKVIAKEMILGLYKPPCGLEIATFYHEKSVRPIWSYRNKRLTRIGDHFFYQES